MQNKLMTAQDAIARFVRDGDCIAFGGFSTNRRAYGLVREVIRQKKKDLTVESGSAGGDIDMLIGAGCVKVMNISYIANSGFTMVCRRRGLFPWRTTPWTCRPSLTTVRRWDCPTCP